MVSVINMIDSGSRVGVHPRGGPVACSPSVEKHFEEFMSPFHTFSAEVTAVGWCGPEKIGFHLIGCRGHARCLEGLRLCTGLLPGH